VLADRHKLLIDLLGRLPAHLHELAVMTTA